jgi:photosystem II stability/assembly factor-like uncharacterized protein
MEMNADKNDLVRSNASGIRRLRITATGLAVALMLAACGGGGGSSTPTTEASQRAVRASATTEPVGLACAAGGARLDAGIDSNGNGVLDASEITSTQYACNGMVGAKGASALVRMVAEASGANCSAGGTKISVGLDANDNGVLDTAEVSGAPSYVCGGTPGAAGTNGVDGTDGANGINGLSSLMAMTPEAAGANCQHGGTKVTSGLDTNKNSGLDSTEVSATSYNCNGAPGAGITWVDVSGTSAQATSGIGYLANNAAQVTITLPTNPVIGDLVEVSGVGAGGWQIAQNASQSIVTKALAASYLNYGSSWVAQAGAGARSWVSVASSVDGSKLVAVELGGQIYTSTDSGVTWTARDSNRDWRSVASSADGSKLVAVAEGGQIYTSTDSGATWTARDSNRDWRSVASSADGSKLVAVAEGGQIYTSTDSGATWTARDSNRGWISVASSADGSKLVALVGGSGRIYTSTDFGVNWTARGSARQWQSVASSADGSKLVAVELNGQIYTSTDSGVNWTARESVRLWRSVASSEDGSKLVAVVNSGQIYTSTDSGATWTARDSNRSWYSVASSADGSKLVAVALYDQIYTSTDSGATWRVRENTRPWVSVASSANGSKLVAVAQGGQIYTSLSFDRTTAGTGGSLTGSQYDAIKLQYIGSNLWMPLSATSYSGSFTVN